MQSPPSKKTRHPTAPAEDDVEVPSTGKGKGKSKAKAKAKSKSKAKAKVKAKNDERGTKGKTGGKAAAPELEADGLEILGDDAAEVGGGEDNEPVSEPEGSEEELGEQKGRRECRRN